MLLGHLCYVIGWHKSLTQYLCDINPSQIMLRSLQLCTCVFLRVCGRLLHALKVAVWLTHQGGDEYFYWGGLHHWGRSVGKSWRMRLAEGKNRGVTVNRHISRPESGEWASERGAVRVSPEKKIWADNERGSSAWFCCQTYVWISIKPLSCSIRWKPTALNECVLYWTSAFL